MMYPQYADLKVILSTNFVFGALPRNFENFLYCRFYYGAQNRRWIELIRDLNRRGWQQLSFMSTDQTMIYLITRLI